MDQLPNEIHYEIINYCKLSCVSVCNSWEEYIRNSVITKDLIVDIENNEEYAILYKYKHPIMYYQRFCCLEVIETALLFNNTLTLKLLLDNIYRRCLQSDNTLQFYAVIDGIIKNNNKTVIDYIYKKGYHKYSNGPAVRWNNHLRHKLAKRFIEGKTSYELKKYLSFQPVSYRSWKNASYEDVVKLVLDVYKYEMA